MHRLLGLESCSVVCLRLSGVHRLLSLERCSVVCLWLRGVHSLLNLERCSVRQMCRMRAYTGPSCQVVWLLKIVHTQGGRGIEALKF